MDTEPGDGSHGRPMGTVWHLHPVHPHSHSHRYTPYLYSHSYYYSHTDPHQYIDPDGDTMRVNIYRRVRDRAGAILKPGSHLRARRVRLVASAHSSLGG